MKRLLLSCFFVMACVFAFSQNKKLDSLYNLLNNHPRQDTIRVQLLTGICYYEYTSDNEKNRAHATEALSISKRLDFKTGIGTSLKYLALYYWVLGDYEQATHYALEMLRVFEGTTNDLALSQSYNLIGLIHERSSEFEKAKEYYLKALEIRQRAGLKRDVGYSYNSLGSLSVSLSKLDEAEDFFLKSLEIRKELNDEEGLSQTYGNLAVIFMKKRQYAAALDYNRKALYILRRLNNKYRTIVNYANMGEVYINLRKYDSAEFYLQKSLAIAQPLHHKEALAAIYEKLNLLEIARDRYKEALTYLELKHQYQDSIFTEKKAKQIAEVEGRYETRKKDQTIHTLEQEKAFQNLKLLYLIIGLAIVSFIFVFIYLLQRAHNRKVKELLENQKLLNLKLKEADELKSKFFANISHEFRTPLTLILAPIEDKLASSNLTPHEKESFQLVTRNANRLLALVNQLLDLSKLEAKKMELAVQHGHLKEFLVVIAASFDSLAESKKINFEKSIRIMEKESWYDADKLEKIINNILFNAFKFTPQDGTVKLSLTQFEDTNDLEIKVSDTGKGIPETEQINIFSPFYQTQYSADDGQLGTGLGLSLVKELVKLYEGKIELTSVINQGTSITITLPMTKERLPAFCIFKDTIAAEARTEPTRLSNDTPLEELETQTIHEETILIIEDNDDLRKFITSTLHDQFNVLTARDGEEGHALAIERIPDLIISDIMMPNLDGIGLTEKIKGDERTCHVPVVLLTAKADWQSKIEGLQTGADDYLSKPFSTEELRVRVINLIEQRKKLAIIYRASLSSPNLSTKEPSLDDKFLLRAKQIVEENIGDSGFSVEKMADELCLSRAQLFRKLKAIANASPNEFINEIRLQRAAELILARADTLTQISYSVGFNEQSYFAKRFRKKFGVSPGEYHRKHVKEDT